MNSTNWPLMTAGVIGCLVAIVHGIITQKKMVNPILSQTDLPEGIRRLLPLLLHFSTICWFFGGVALAVAPYYFSSQVVMTIAVIVGAFYLIGAIGNLWGTRGNHPGWILLAAAVVLIVYAF